MNYLVIGDIHGNYEKLLEVHDKAKTYEKNFTVIATGDLIDRGPDSKKVIDWFVKNKYQSVRGNHELWLTYGETSTHFVSAMGGTPTLASYGFKLSQLKDFKLPFSHQQFIKEMPAFIEFTCGKQDFIVTHAGLPHHVMAAGLTPQDYLILQPEEFFWHRSYIKDKFQFKNKIQIYGHTIHPKITKLGNVYAIDTGCSTRYPLALSALLILEDGRIIEITC